VLVVEVRWAMPQVPARTIPVMPALILSEFHHSIPCAKRSHVLGNSEEETNSNREDQMMYRSYRAIHRMSHSPSGQRPPPAPDECIGSKSSSYLLSLSCSLWPSGWKHSHACSHRSKSCRTADPFVMAFQSKDFEPKDAYLAGLWPSSLYFDLLWQ
jgi:hypothetical protein